MRSAVTLYEFMPYGAPELLESRQRNMSRALALTSAMALAIGAIAVAIAPTIRVEDRPRLHSRISYVPEQYVLPPPLKPQAPLADHTKIKPAPPDIATVEPVRDDLAPPPPDAPTSSQSSAITGETGSSTGPGTMVQPGTGIEVLPKIGEWFPVDQEPVVVREVKPEYPDIARSAYVEGLVTVHVLVGKEGRVLDVSLDKTFQVPMLNAAALEASRKWVFTPAMVNGKPVAFWTVIPFRFTLH
ncbi:MAG TPA: TonB family protein [Candidatus Eisenbacteria bacterium]|nr:TonB family protein [Candidatus Eisenbacteria bacterium]